MFLLKTKSYAKVKCDMDFGIYPFDTQKCNFVITPDKNLTYQGDYSQSLLRKSGIIIAMFYFRSSKQK